MLRKLLPILVVLSVTGCGMTGSKAKRTSSERKYNPEVMSHIIRGTIADLIGESKEALFEYHQAAELDTTSASIYLALAEDYFYIEKYSNVLRLAQKALRVDPENINALELMAVTYEKTGDFAGAMTTIKKMVKIDPENLDYLFNLVTLEIIAGEYKQAVKDYFVMVKKGLQDLESRMRIGHMFLRHNASGEAEQIYLDVYRDYPDKEVTYLALAAVSKSKSDTTQAIHWYQSALDKNVKFKDVRAELQLILEKKNLWDQAISIFQGLVARDSTNLTNKLQLGQYYLFKGDSSRAEEYLFKTVTEHPKTERGYLALAAVQKLRGDTTAAVETYKAALTAKGDFHSARKKLSEIYADQNQWKEAISLYEEIQGNDTTHVGARIEIINLLAQKGDSLNALEEGETLLKEHPDDWRIPITLGKMHYSAHQYVKAADYFKKTTELRSDLPHLWILQGITCLQMDSLKQAQETFESALKKFPDHPQFYYYMGTVLVRLRSLTEAIEYFKKATQLDPENQQTILSLAGAYDELSMHDLSQPLYEKLIADNLGNAVVLNNYAYHLSVRGVRLNDALEMVKKALEIDPENAPYLDTLGWIFYQKGDYNQAKTYIEKALAIRADTPEVLEHMGDIYDKLGDENSAKYYWLKALDLEKNRQSVLKRLGKFAQ